MQNVCLFLELGLCAEQRVLGTYQAIDDANCDNGQPDSLAEDRGYVNMFPQGESGLCKLYFGRHSIYWIMTNSPSNMTNVVRIEEECNS